VLLEARELGRAGAFRDASLQLAAGEIVGLAGLMGSFRSELGRALCGILRPSAGEIRLRGEPVRWANLSDAMRRRVAYVPAERKTDGLFLDLSLAENLTVAAPRKVSRAGLFSRPRAAAAARRAIERLRIKAPGPGIRVGALSGGNQQKTLLARVLEIEPEVLVVEEPTRGVDVGSKREIHALLARLAENGAAILLISSDLVELIGICDRILVMHAGRIVSEVAAAEASEEAIVALASGLPAVAERAA
jgi:ribose transport system ATP-binding protein